MAGAFVLAQRKPRPGGEELDHDRRPALLQCGAKAGGRHGDRPPAVPGADRAPGQPAGGARGEFALNRRSSQHEVEPCDLPGEEPAPTPGASLSAPFVLALMAVVDRRSTNGSRKRRTRNPAQLEKTMRGNVTQLPERAASGRRAARPKAHGPSCHTSCRTIAPARSTASGPPRPTCTTVGADPAGHAHAQQHDRPKIFCVGNRQFDPRKVGLAKRPGGCGAYTASTQLGTAISVIRSKAPTSPSDSGRTASSVADCRRRSVTRWSSTSRRCRGRRSGPASTGGGGQARRLTQKFLGIAKADRSAPSRFLNDCLNSRSGYAKQMVDSAFNSPPLSPTFAASRPPRVLSRGIAMAGRDAASRRESVHANRRPGGARATPPFRYYGRNVQRTHATSKGTAHVQRP